MKTIPLAQFLGINNRKPDFMMRVATSTMNGQYLRSGDNIEINNAGKIQRRNGTQLIQALTAPHSIYMETATTGYIVRASVLYAVTLPTYSETLVKVLTSNDPVSYEALGDSIYFSNGTDIGRITAGVWYPIGLPSLDSPTTTTIGGALLAGWYQVGLSYSNSVTGEEGGISASANHELTDTGGIRVTLPATTPGATHINIYMSNANGEVPLWLASVAVDTTLYDCIGLPTGRESPQRFEAPLPAGRLFMSNGRLCSHYEETVYVGLPYRPGYYLPAEGYITFPSAVTNAIENQGGTYITADKTYWVPGDLGAVKENLATVLPYGGVPGTTFRSTNKSTTGWFGMKGVVLGATTGEVQAVMSDNIDLTPPASGLAAVFETDGYRRVMSCGWCVNLDNFAATTYSDWSFTSVSENYATASDGIYLVDTTGAVDASIGFGKINFETELLKHLPNVYIGVDAESPMQLRVQAPNGIDFMYDARSSGADMQEQRFDTGKGLRATWFDLMLYNQNGADFTLANISFAPTATNRRI